MNPDAPMAIHRMLAKYAAEVAGTSWSYLEVGCCEGKSLFAVIEAGDPWYCTICDTWGKWAGGSNRGNHDHIATKLKNYPAVTATFLDGDSKTLIPSRLHNDKHYENFHVVNVDGDHSWEGAALDLLHCWPLVAAGGVLVFDDITHVQHGYLMDLAKLFSRLIGQEFDSLDLHDNGACAWRKS